MNSDKLMKKTNDPESWLSYIPYDTRQLAIKNCIGSFKSSLALKKNGHIKQFKHKFLSRKKPAQVFYVDHRALKPDSIRLFKTRLNNPLRMTNKGKRWFHKNVKQVDHDFIVMRENKRYYLCLTFKKTKEFDKPKGDSVFLDPGVRTFQTFYSPGLKDNHHGSAGKIGDKFIDKLRKLNNKIDNLTSLSTTKRNAKTKKHIKDRCSSLRTKIKNKVTDLHWQTANYLCKTYQNVFLPSFDTKQMVKRTKRNINKLTVRSMLNLSHYKFKERLIHMGNQMNRNILICREDYTSKTCSNCGNIKSNLGGNKVYKCELCNYEIDRDLNGAYNICVRQLLSFT